MKKEELHPSIEAQKEAYHNPNGWVYVIDDKFKNCEKVPPEAIKGAWKVDSKGKIEGEFIPNPNYNQTKST